MAIERFLTASVMYVGSVSVDINVKAPSDLLLLRLLIFGACGWRDKKTHNIILLAEIKTKQTVGHHVAFFQEFE